MDFKPILIVDTLAVNPAHQMEMLSLLKEEGIPVMQDAGLELVGSAPLAGQQTGPAWSRLVWARRS